MEMNSKRFLNDVLPNVIFNIIQATLVVMKLRGSEPVASWSWWLVFFPIWIDLVIELIWPSQETIDKIRETQKEIRKIKEEAENIKKKNEKDEKPDDSDN